MPGSTHFTTGIFTLTVIVTLQATVTYGANTCCSSCCTNSNCSNIPAANVSLASIVKNQIYNVVILPAIPIFAGIDNVCWSFLNLTQTTYTLYTTEVFCNGLNFTSAFMATQTRTGVQAFNSPLCNFEGTVFAQLIIKEERCNITFLYLCFLFGDCQLAQGNKIPIVGISPSGSRLTSVCVVRARDVLYRAGFGLQDYFILPMRIPSQCVTKYPK